MVDTSNHSVPFGHYTASALQSRLMSLGHAMPKTWAGRRVTSLIRSFLKRWSQHPIDAVRLGSRMRLHPQGNASEKRLMTSPQFFDPAELRVLESVLTPSFVFFDIGANVGAYTLFVANRVGRSATVVAVEPHPGALARLRCNLDLNGLDWVRVAPVALAERAGTLSLYVNDRNIGSSTANPERESTGKAIEVECRTLIELVEAEGVGRIDACKVDVEGAEDRVLVPFFAAAPPETWPRLLIIENNREAWSQDLLGMLERLGYENAGSPGANLILRRERGAQK
jgi:FkbM family methyltransferase